VMTSGMPAEPGIPIKASHDAGILVLSDIFLDGHGPFGTTIDTCNASSLIRLQIARRPAFRAPQWSPVPQPRWELSLRPGQCCHRLDGAPRTESNGIAK
jgi:hypothetical protein